MRIQIRSDSVTIDGYVNAVGRDSRPITDRSTGKRFIEQIKPKAFERALSHSGEVALLLNHDKTRVLGSTKDSLELYEDSIGLRASATVTDPEVMEKARKHELKGWSFGFIPKDVEAEELPDGMERRYVGDMDLFEVSIIDSRKQPCYDGTLIETRADGDNAISDTLETKAEYSADMSSFEARIRALENK